MEETRAVELQRREELDSWLRRYGLHPSDAAKASRAVVDAGWVHPAEVERLRLELADQSALLAIAARRAAGA